AEHARRFLQLLRQTIVELGISDAEMEKGTLRCDANVSVREAGEEGLRTRWELKNMNSFTFIGRGIDAAVREQVAIHEADGEGVPPREAFNFVMNQSVPSGADFQELAKIIKATKKLTRAALTGAVAASSTPGFTADTYLEQTTITDTTELEPLIERILAANES